MAKDPGSRFQTAEDFRDALDLLRGVNPTAQIPAASAAAAPAPTPVVPFAPEAELTGGEAAEEELVTEMSESRWNSWGLVAAGLFTFLVAVWAFFLVFRRL